MSKATEAALAELHGAVAIALTGAVQGGVETSEDGTATRVIPASAAHIMAAITFLKNNNITADASSNSALDDLSKALAAKRQSAKQRMSRVDVQAAADELDRDLGMHTGALQ